MIKFLCALHCLEHLEKFPELHREEKREEGDGGYQEENAAAKLLQLCLTLCEPIDGSPPGSPVPGILKARTLEWVAIYFSNA